MSLTLRCLPLLLLLAGCAGLDSRFVIETSPTLPTTPQSVSAFGALKDGHLDDGWWRELLPWLTPTLGPGCTPFFDDALQAKAPELYDRLDMKSREEGVSDELLGDVAARARGQLILVAYRAGKLPDPTQKRPPSQQGPHPALAEQHSGRGWHDLQARRRAHADDYDPGLDLTLYFYSLAEKQTVAQIALHYTGASVDEAYKMLGRKLAEMFGDFRCVGWK